MCDLFFDGEAHDRMHRICTDMGMNPGQIRTLMRLSPDGSTAMRDLGDHFGCDASYVTALVDSLEDRGLARREPHPTDRRVKQVALTPHGQKLRAHALEILHEPPAALLELTAAEQRALRDLLQKAAAADPVLARTAEPSLRSARSGR